MQIRAWTAFFLSDSVADGLDMANTSASEARPFALYFVLQCKAMKEVTISRKNQIVVPREAREALGAGPGDKLVVIVCSNRTFVLQKPKSYRAALRGLAKDIYPPDYVEKERGSWD